MEPERYIQTYRYAVSTNEADAIRNCRWFAWFLLRKPYQWSLQAICAALGNWEVETHLNPNYPQSADFPTAQKGGFGMPQWTPWYDKFGIWVRINYGLVASATDDNPLADFGLQMEYHEYECVNGYNGGKTWYNNGGYSYTWEEWKHSTDDVETLANAYYYQYERSGAGNPGTRPEKAKKWWNYFQENPPDKDVPAWLLFKFNERRR